MITKGDCVMTNRPPASRPVTDDFPNDLDAANGSFLHPPRPLAPPSPSVGVVDEPRPSWLEAPAAADVAAKVRAADVTPFESAPVSSRPSGSQVLDAQRGVAMSGPGDDSGAVGRFLTDLVGGSDHPKPLWYRKRVWYLTLCLAFAASPLIATLLALSTTTSASVESTTLASIAASTVDDEQPATRLSSARAGAAKPIPIPAAASAPVGLTPVPEPSGPEPRRPTTSLRTAPHRMAPQQMAPHQMAQRTTPPAPATRPPRIAGSGSEHL